MSTLAVAAGLFVLGTGGATYGARTDDPDRPIGHGPGLLTLAGVFLTCAGLWVSLTELL